MKIVNVLSTYLWSYVLIGLLLASGLFYTIRTRFVQFVFFKDMLLLITGKLSSLKDGDEKNKNKISAFQAFCISVSAHVGTGNLAGVAIAVVLGGPGALFWMWLTAILGCATSLIENALAQIYKEKDCNGGFIGGPAYYMKNALGWKTAGYIFSIIVILTFSFAFNTVQSNTIAQALDGSAGLNAKIAGLVIAILTALVIFGGIKCIATIASLIVPVMAVGYVLVALFVLVINLNKIPSLLLLIVESAFGYKALAGGAIGTAMLQGIKRGLYSNEAGMGSAPNAAAASETSHPVKQGLMQAFGVFIDTILICSATGFIVLLLPNYAQTGETGIKLTQIALSSEVGFWGNWFITICLLLFAFSSIIGNYYYGEANIEFLARGNKLVMTVFRALCVIVIYIGAVSNLSDVWDIADVFMGIMALMNIVAITVLSPKAFSVLKNYAKQRNEKKNPVYYAKDTPEIVGETTWE